MKSQDIEARLIVELYRRSFVVPRYCPRGWWECDLFELTPAGMWREYEIKMSRADYQADARKSLKRYDWKADVETTKVKHERLAARDPRGPNRFSFVVPANLVKLDEVPDWAGLIYAHPSMTARPWSCEIEIVRKPPQLHGQSAEYRKDHALGVCYYRMNNLYMNSRLDFEPTECAPVIEPI